MRRRDFITLLGSGLAAWPRLARAQHAMTPTIGYLSDRSPVSDAPTLAAFRQGLEQVGYVEGQSLQIEYRWADGQYDRLPELAADLVRRQVGVIAAINGAVVSQAAKAVTATIPIVFRNDRDPVDDGLVARNTTGVTNNTFELVETRFEILREFMPRAATIGVLVNPTTLTPEKLKTFIKAAVSDLEQPIIVFNASSLGEVEAAFARAVRRRVESLLVLPDSMFRRMSDKIVELAANYRIPTNYPTREFTEAGGLMSYGYDRVESYSQAGIYVGRILNGEKPSDLPVLQHTKFDFVINLKAAAALNLDIPPTLLARADELIE